MQIMRASVWLNVVAVAFAACGIRQLLAHSKFGRLQTTKHTHAECYTAQRTIQQAGGCSVPGQDSR